MSDTTQPTSTPTAEDGFLLVAFRRAGQIAVGARRYLLSITALLVSLGVLLAKGGELGGHVWIFALLAVLPLAFVLLVEALPAFLQKRRERWLRDWSINQQAFQSGYFSLAPYEGPEKDRARFHREDKAHVEALAWLTASPAPILFLTGVSGPGKTSLLNAHVLPELRNSVPGVRIVSVRSYDDPVEALRRELLEPDVVWIKVP